MRNLDQVPNIGGSSPANPDGVIIDETGGTPGTALTEILYGDLIQVVHKLKRLAAITPNNTPDNETNGFQLLTAFMANMVPPWYPDSDNVDFSKTKWVTYNNGFYYHITTNNTNNNPGVDTTNWFRVFYWNGTKIVFSDLTSRLDNTESNLADFVTAIKNRYPSLNTLEEWIDQANDEFQAIDDFNSLITIGIPSIDFEDGNSGSITIRQRGNTIEVNGWFNTGGTNASQASPIILVKKDAPTVDTPGIRKYFAASGNQGEAARGYLEYNGTLNRLEFYYDCDTANTDYYFGFSYVR